MTSASEALPTPIRREPLPGAYRLWVSGVIISLLGNGMLYFAIGWTATAQSGQLAGLVLTAINIPRALLLLLGGAVGDRFGARRVMIVGDAVMLAVCLVFALLLHLSGTQAWILLLTGLAVGIIDAFYLPASGSMPRQLVDQDQLPRALGVRQAGGQIVALVGAPVGAVLVVAVGLSGVLLVNALTFAAILIVLIMVKPCSSVPAATGSLLRSAIEGLKFSAGDPILRPILVLTGALAGFVLPVFTILVPPLSRENGWNAGGAGLVVGAQALGTIAMALLVARRGKIARAGLVSIGGVLLTAVGLLELGLSAHLIPAVAAALVAGVGMGLFAAHVGPTVLIATPESHLSRVQSLLTLVQALTLLVTNNVIGSLTDAAGPVSATVVCATVLALAAALSFLSEPLRRA